mmetsp:Transcript_14025/g.21834  ORF Transcript_14025/g.21834 Transcript_14025/m.21834 type:complete len:128 (-) Transcript_14025:710-1093(-)
MKGLDCTCVQVCDDRAAWGSHHRWIYSQVQYNAKVCQLPSLATPAGREGTTMPLGSRIKLGRPGNLAGVPSEGMVSGSSIKLIGGLLVAGTQKSHGIPANSIAANNLDLSSHENLHCNACINDVKYP